MDKFKQYIQQHAKELDLDEPSAKVWNTIKYKQTPAKVFSMLSIAKYAVAACVIILAGIGVWHLMGNQQNTKVDVVKEATQTNNNATKNDTVVSPQNIASADVTEQPADQVNTPTEVLKPADKKSNKTVPKTANKAPEMGMLRYVENSFMQVINVERQRVNSSPIYAETPAYFNDFKNRMMQMDNDEKQIRNDIKNAGPNSAMIDQLINIYQQKLNVLRQLQTEMNKLNNRYKQNKPASDSVGTYFLNV